MLSICILTLLVIPNVLIGLGAIWIQEGTFQGDSLSLIIFYVFQAIAWISGKQIDFSLNTTKIITTPFADDFNLITNNKTQHQQIINELQTKATGMGLTLKLSKCRSFSSWISTNCPYAPAIIASPPWDPISLLMIWSTLILCFLTVLTFRFRSGSANVC